MSSLQALWRRRDLVQTLASSDFKARYRRLGLGVVWAVVTPLVQGLVIAAVFSLLRRGEARYPFPFALFVLTGIMPWQFFLSAMLGGSRSLLDAGQIVQRVRLPRAALPTATIAAQLYNLAFMLGVLLLIVAAFAFDRLGRLWLLPAGVLLLVGLSYGIALTFATLQVRFRDVEPLMQAATMVWFWVTPIIYGLHEFGLNEHPAVQNLIRANPMTGVVGLFRAAYLGLPVDAWATVSAAAWTLFLLLVGWRVFTRREATVADFL